MGLKTEERTIGDSGLSIATHLSMENIFPIPRYDLERPLANPLDLNDYTYFLFNFYTLVRNIYNSYKETDKVSIIKDKDFYSVIEDEVLLLQNYFDNFNKTKFVIYRPDYEDVFKSLNIGKEYKLGVKYEDYLIIDKYIDKFLSKGNNLYNMVEQTSHLFPKMEGDVIVMTHFSHDLLNKGRLYLLESHTGKLKSNKDFYTKLHSVGVRDMSYVPFCEQTYYIFGDTNLIRALPIIVRKNVLALGIEKNWTYKTSPAMIKYHLESDTDTKGILKQFKSIYK